VSSLPLSVLAGGGILPIGQLLTTRESQPDAAPAAPPFLDTCELTFFENRRSSGWGPRTALLTDRERARWRMQEERRQLCGSSWVMLERTLYNAGALVRERMAVKRRCRMRDCPVCAPIDLARRADRLRGPWRYFITLTIPTDIGDPLECWRRLPKWRSEFLTRLRQSHKKWSSWLANGNGLQYAWVAEATQQGYPHLHVCIDQEPPDEMTLQDLWTGALGLRWTMIDVGPIKDRHASCAYLCDYVAKWSGSAEILAVLGRNRLWGRTDDHLARDVDNGWRIESERSLEVFEATEGLRPPAETPGWSPMEREEGWYASWRQVSLPMARTAPSYIGCGTALMESFVGTLQWWREMSIGPPRVSRMQEVCQSDKERSAVMELRAAMLSK
jgi:hypothetical protein